MGRAKTVEINGRKYDASSGKLVQQTSQKSTRGHSIDGFTKPKKASQVHARTSKSRTLDRKAVSKTKHQVKAANQANHATKTDTHKKKSHAHKVDPHREKRAATVAKSSLISKFGTKSQASEEVVAKKTKPAIPPQHHQAPVTQQSNYSAEEPITKKVKNKKQKTPRRFMNFKFKPKARSVFAVALLAFLFAGYLTYLNIPNLSLRIAASRAGIDATLPGYKPSGFAMSGPINYSQGLVTVNFSSNTDERAFAIIERGSTWDSESLRANFVEAETTDYTTFQNKGLTIYVYNGSNATWVDGGIWYTIEGESQLNSDQLLRIAASM